MKLVLYPLILLILAPIFLIGIGFFLLPILRSRGEVSGTTYEPFSARLIYHLFGSRLDPLALQLAKGLPATSPIVMWLMFRPMIWASEMSGYIPDILNYPPPQGPLSINAMMAARCEFLDQAIAESVQQGDQIVILGAGWDTRAYALLKSGLNKHNKLSIFEVDAPATQAVKRSALGKSGIDDSHVVFVSCDFNQQSWLDALVENGFDTTLRTFILWEGVTYYLKEQAIQSTLRAVATLPKGSSIAFDFFSRQWMDSFTGKMARSSINITYGEAMIFGFPIGSDFSESLNFYLEDNGLRLKQHRCLYNKDKPAYGGIALAENPQAKDSQALQGSTSS